MRVSLAVKERGAPAPLVREMSVLSGEDNEDNMDHAKLSTVHYIMYCRRGGAGLHSPPALPGAPPPRPQAGAQEAEAAGPVSRGPSAHIQVASTTINSIVPSLPSTSIYQLSIYLPTGCCKTSGKLWKHIFETLYGVFFVFLGSFDCQIWEIFHFATLWANG